MFSIFKRHSQQERSRKDLLNFLAEMERNLESYYVIDQRRFITDGFLMVSWPLVKDTDIVKKHESIMRYVGILQDFNDSFKQYKDYEAWYAGDINRKTPENAKKLHALKSDMDNKLNGIEAVIITAGQDLEREMLKLGLLKS